MTPDEHTNQEHMLDVGDGHQLYVHDWGKPDATVPIVFVHGGPGNGCKDRDKSKFDATTQRVIFYDQRGAGKSTPTGSLKHNTSEHLVTDITHVLDELNLSQVVLVGGSWGSTLALLYAIANPNRVAGLVIDGVFTATAAEHAWLDNGEWRTFAPHQWAEYQATVPAEHQQNPTAYHFEQALGDNAEAAKKSAYAYNNMEASLVKLDEAYTAGPYDTYDPTGAIIEMHYLSNYCFVEEGYILSKASRLTMPVYIVQGRYDLVCPPLTAHMLDAALPNSKLVWTINGHVKQHEANNIVSLLLKQLTGAS